jgi:hypothetical protein
LSFAAKHGRRRGSLLFDCAGHIVDVAFKQSNAARQPITFSNQCAHLRG